MSRDKDGTLVNGGSQRKEKYTEAEEGESSQVIRGNTGVSIRLEIPIFKGDHPDLRLYRAEHNFDIHELT